MKKLRISRIDLTILAALACALQSAEVAASRTVTFSTVGRGECYVSVYNPGSSPLTLSWTVQGGDGANAWNQAYAKVAGSSGAPITSNVTGNLAAGGTVQVAFTKYSDVVGTLAGTLTVAESIGAVVATGVCIPSKAKVGIPFIIAGGQPF